MARLLAGEHDTVTFVGTPDGLEARIVPEAGVLFRALPARGFDRARPWTVVTSAVLTASSALRMWWEMGRKRPDVVVGFGGYVSIPVGLAAAARGVPLILHEQNSVPGLANRLLSRWARTVAVTYPESASYLKYPARAVVTGNPVREAVLASSREEGRRSMGLPPEVRVLLVFGGSRGARHLNSAIVALAPELMELDGLRVVHVAGRAEADVVREELANASGFDVERWMVYDYIDDMGAALASADLVVCRAGATSIAELTALGVPAVLVPYPYATDDHQSKNAASMVNRGAARLVTDSQLDEPLFSRVVMGLLGDTQARASMSAASRALGAPDAAARAAELVRSAARTQAIR